MSHQNPITGTISITVLPQENGSYRCQIVPIFNDESRTAQVFYGQTPEHTIAMALESLADEYRTLAEESQESNVTEDKREKLYHVILHYEHTIRATSKFDAIHNTLLGNLVVENAECTVIEISPDVQHQLPEVVDVEKE